MAELDLKLVIIFLMLGVVWIAFLGLYNDNPNLNSVDGDDTSLTFSIPNLFNNLFNTDNILINTFVFIPLGIIGTLLAFRAIRGV